ncbi:MAG: serine/threonine-protein phosphatase [Thermoleophilia bacterium]|nr:serine/threonine-protein phosphatase [Thermoleophilia bacterium]
MNDLQELTVILEMLQWAGSFGDAGESLVRWARDYTGAESAILRLLQPDPDAPWLMACMIDGASDSFARDETVIHGGECICGRVAAGSIDTSLPFYTEAGSFCWGSLGSLSRDFTPEQVGPLRGRCMEELFESVAIVPVRAQKRIVGALHLADKRKDSFAGSFEVVEAVCRLAGETLMRHRTREREQAVLTAIETALLPTAPPRVDGLEIGVSFTSATEMAHMGGDFYDVLDLGDAGVLIVVGDVSGKGVEATGVAARARYALEERARTDPDPATFLSATNDSLARVLPRERFVTAAACLVDQKTGLATVCLAGHPSPLVITECGGDQIDAPHNPPLGVWSGLRYEEASRRLLPNDLLLVYTDGLSEARRGATMFGTEGIVEAAVSRTERDAGSIARAVCSAASEFHDTGRPDDDRLAIAVRLRGSD